MKRQAMKFFRLNRDGLLKAMAESGVGINELSIRCGITAQAIYSWMRGDTNPRVTNVYKVANAICNGKYEKIVKINKNLKQGAEK